MPDSEVEAAARLAAKPASFERRTSGTEPETIGYALPPAWMWREADHERFREEPRRSRGTSLVYDAEAFVRAVHKREFGEDQPTTLYADEAANALTAVINDDTNTVPGWRDYRVELELRRTPEWKSWLTRDGNSLSQETFAQHIEDSLAELRDPPASEMLELAQTFHATTNAKFKGGSRLASGARQFQYEEDIEATAGSTGTISIPERLSLAVSPFYGAPRYEVGAWFRFRLTRDQFTLGYKLDRPHDVERAAFTEVRTKVAEELTAYVMISGPAPEVTQPR